MLFAYIIEKTRRSQLYDIDAALRVTTAKSAVSERLKHQNIYGFIGMLFMKPERKSFPDYKEI